ncbi:neutral/alkaline non-lysosomal ceramidase N-terminal domain-containing protein [Bacillus luteolus]|uniref:Neutral ceramidase n=2 Tax=Litchfieldia luteola TaxID=682179 RepID=A0ABR9QF68_9BACI|nr:neutral/alkaline non-lysosomal ceramidase N-terminal domain-containing protein [Cytobacillus luteolus]MBE4907125.1 neutral/alkaline non-lysosomal ceramidase N-terminal domain-containing protein [Cytobacillus luteolus]MBP1943406.1 hypothetical protein [Cytobacillus luteolus]
MISVLVLSLFIPSIGLAKHDDDDDDDDDKFYEAFEAGVAQNRISPTKSHLAEGVYLGGYDGFKQRGKAIGVADPIYARALALKSESEKLVFVTLDTTGVGNKVLNVIREKASKKTGVSKNAIMISSTHTHAGPDLQGLWGGVSNSYKDYFINQVVKTIEEAVDDQEDSMVTVGSTVVPQNLVHNRRGKSETDTTLTTLQITQLEKEKGKGKGKGKGHQKGKGKGHDKGKGKGHNKGDDDEEKVIATLINFAVHPTILGRDNKNFSADFVGYLHSEVEDQFGGISLFVNGALGDATPISNGNTDQKKAEYYGKEIAKYVEKAIDNARVLPKGLKITNKKVDFVVENQGFVSGYNTGILSPYYEMKKVNNVLKLESTISRVTIGDKNTNIELVTAPGEAVTGLGLSLRKVMDNKYSMILGLTHDTLGYLIPESEWDPKKYEEQVSIERAAGEKVRNVVLELYGKKSQPLPQPVTLKAGASKEKITPTTAMMDATKQGPLYLGGYGNGRKADPNQVLDELWARTIILQSGGKTVAFTALDSVGIFQKDSLEIQKRARDALRTKGIYVDHIVVSSTHTHHAPDTMGLWGAKNKSGINPFYQEYLISQAAKSIINAATSMQTVKELRYGVQDTSGLIRDSRDPNVMDDDIYVMHAVGLNNQTIGTLVKWASHPETILGHYNEAITSDYVHPLRETVEKSVGGTTVFVNGAIGGLLTSLKVDVGYGTGKEGSKATMKVIGERAGIAALTAIKNSTISKDHTIKIATRDVYLPLENPNYYLLGYYGMLNRDVYINGAKQSSMPLPPQYGGKQVDLLTEVSAVKIGDAQFAMVPGELYPEIELGKFQTKSLAHNPNAAHELAIKPNMSGKYNFVLGLSNDAIGYIIPRNDFVPLVQDGLYWKEGIHRIQNKQLYGEINSVGPSTAAILSNTLVELLRAIK